MAEALVQIQELSWNGLNETLLLNPKLPDLEKTKIWELYKKRTPLADHLWLTSSGTASKTKLIALSREALLVSAQAVNDQIQASKKDHWALCLPTFHVGGLGILARAHLSHSTIETLGTWDPKAFLKLCRDKNITLTSLVPSQLESLVRLSDIAPPSLRVVFLGGGSCREEILQKARTQGYPIRQTYGMTECASQVALQEDFFLPLKSLPIWKLESGPCGRLQVSGAALATCILNSDQEILFPLSAGYFQTEDYVELKEFGQGRWEVFPKGRGHDFAKIKGENVSLNRLQEILDCIKSEFPLISDAAIYFTQNAKDSEPSLLLKLCVLNSFNEQKESFLQKYKERTLPFEFPSQVEQAAAIERTALGKIVRKAF